MRIQAIRRFPSKTTIFFHFFNYFFPDVENPEFKILQND